MAFYVGQKVICVDDNPAYSGDDITPPTYGCIYTISEIEITLGKTYVAVHEIKHRPHPTGLYQCPWRATRFRPLTSNHTDISIFTAMLGPKLKERV